MTLTKNDNALNFSLINFSFRIDLYINFIHKYAKLIFTLTLMKTEKKAFSRFNLRNRTKNVIFKNF